jgi:hypothetical protein
MMQGFPLGSYVNLVEYTGRLFRQGKASISEDLAGIFERLGFSAPSAGSTGWKSSAAIVWWAASTRPAARNCGKSPNASACGTWST